MSYGPSTTTNNVVLTTTGTAATLPYVTQPVPAVWITEPTMPSDTFSPKQLQAIKHVFTDPEMVKLLVLATGKATDEQTLEFWQKFAAMANTAWNVCKHCRLPRLEHMKDKCLFSPTTFTVEDSYGKLTNALEEMYTVKESMYGSYVGSATFDNNTKIYKSK